VQIYKKNMRYKELLIMLLSPRSNFYSGVFCFLPNSLCQAKTSFGHRCLSVVMSFPLNNPAFRTPGWSHNAPY
jgi:hypothetical protein